MPKTVRSPVSKRRNPSDLPRTPPAAAISSTGHGRSSETSLVNTEAPQSPKIQQNCSEKTGEVIQIGSSDKEVEEVGVTPGSSARCPGMVKPVKKLENEAYRLWGTNSNPNSRSNSDVGSDTATETCKGGPGKKVCGEPVEDGVMCDSCGYWFHALCQQIPKPAITALKKHKVLSWLCDVCKVQITSGNGKSGNSESKVTKQLEALDKVVRDHINLIEPTLKAHSEFQSLEAKVDKLELTVRNHEKMVANSMREQERAAEEQVRLLKRSFEQQSTQKTSYADMLKSTCSSVIKEVNTKLDAIPRLSMQRDEAKTVQDMSCIFDTYLDKDKRKLNVVVHNLPEESGETLAERSSKDQTAFQKVVKEGLKLSVRTSKSFRVGKKIPERPRLLIITIDTLEAKLDLLSKVPQLKDTKWRNIYINPDLTKEEREEGRKLRAELKSRRQAGETNLSIRRGRVVSLPPKSSDPSIEFQNSTQHTIPSPRDDVAQAQERV